MVDIPKIKRDGKLMTRLLPIVITGFDRVMDTESQLYLRLLTRLVDKAFDEYETFREYIQEEIKDNDRLSYRFLIINHLENCVSAISRAGKIMYSLANGVTPRGKAKVVRDLDIYDLVSGETRNKISTKSVLDIRNRVEHIDEDIYIERFDKILPGLFLDITVDYASISINNISLPLYDLAEIISIYHELMLEIFEGLPTSQVNGVYKYR